MNNNMSPQNSLFLTETGEVDTLGNIIVKAISTASGGGAANNVELSSNSTHLLWKLQSEQEWKELIPLSRITGPQGQKGATGATGAPGFGTKEQYDGIIARLTALENPGA